jgi:oligopeptide/dipeptide ABC transporter ATP-binding protein
MNAPALLTVRDFSLSFSTEVGQRRVLDHADLRVERGEIHGLIGESGCGKSTLVRAILGLLPLGSSVDDGAILLEDFNLLKLDEAVLARDIRARRIGFIPQDPFQSFNPLFRVGTQLLEIMRWHAGPAQGKGRNQHRLQLIKLLERVQISEPSKALDRYPHEFSGGQLQRLMIAGALACGPDVILADEPTSALDVTTQQQILLLLEELARETRTAVVVVTHDLGLVAQFCDRVTIMYAGQTVETLPSEAVLHDTSHPYARMLLDCHPDRDGALRGIPGIVPALGQMPDGCRFHPRCPVMMDICGLQFPSERIVGKQHRARCWALDAKDASEIAHAS